jgi:phage terminase large subunit-like protein
MTVAKQYADWVLDPANERETGRLIKLAAKRFLSDLERDDIYFDEVEACRMPEMCEANLCQWEGDFIGEPLKFQPWQRFHLEQIYGWIRKDTGTRRFNEVYIQIAKKNGKSTEAAGVMVDHVFFETKVNTPKCFTAANNIDQARIAVNMAGRIIEGSESFYDMLHKEKLIKLMHYGDNILGVINEENNGFIKAFSKETGDKTKKTAGGKHGVNASLGVVDEFGMSPDHGASGPIKTSMASRRERLMFYITTAGYNMDGPCYKELRKVGIQVLEGTVIKDNYLPIIYEIDPPKNEKGEDQEITLQWLLDNEWCWKQANPNLDVSVVRDFLRESLKDAIQYGGPIASDTLTLNFNMWINSPDVFIAADVWNKNAHGLEIESGAECYGGLEIAPSGELSAFCLLFPGEIVKVKMIYFMSEEAMKQNEFYKDNKELILVDPGNEVEVDVAVNWLFDEAQKYYMHSFCYPNELKNNSIVQGLTKMGYTGNPISQALGPIASPTEEWRKLLNAGKVDHGGDPILAWQNSHCQAIKKEKGSRIEKHSKVLAPYACINAFAQWKTISAGETNDQLIEIWR